MMNIGSSPKSVSCRSCPVDVDKAQRLPVTPSNRASANHLPSGDMTGWNPPHGAARRAGIRARTCDGAFYGRATRISRSAPPGTTRSSIACGEQIGSRQMTAADLYRRLARKSVKERGYGRK